MNRLLDFLDDQQPAVRFTLFLIACVIAGTPFSLGITLFLLQVLPQ